MSIGEQIRNQVWVRLADSDIEPVIDWCQANQERNAFDRDVLTYPATKVLAAHNGEKVFAYMPVQGAAMLESIGPNPDATPLEVSSALFEMVQGAALMAHANGMREMYFLSSDEVTSRGAEKMGFVELPYRVYRKRL